MEPCAQRKRQALRCYVRQGAELQGAKLNQSIEVDIAAHCSMLFVCSVSSRSKAVNTTARACFSSTFSALKTSDSFNHITFMVLPCHGSLIVARRAFLCQMHNHPSSPAFRSLTKNGGEGELPVGTDRADP